MWKPSWSLQFTWFIVDKMRKPNGAETSAPGLKIWNFTGGKFTDSKLRTSCSQVYSLHCCQHCNTPIFTSGEQKVWGNSLSYHYQQLDFKPRNSAKTPRMQPLHHSRSQEANWTLQRPDLSSPRPSARRWCSGEQSGSYLAVLPQNWDTSSGYTWIWRFWRYIKNFVS